MDPIDILSALVACFCTNLESSPGGAPGQCCLVSTAPIIPECCGGVAWVRALQIYPTLQFPAVDQTPSRCRPPMWAMVVELGLDRCAVPVCDDLGNPCCDLEADATNVLLGDFAAMNKTLTCCFPGGNPDAPARDQIVPGPWVVGDPEGGCIRSTMTATIQFTQFCSC